MVTADIVELDSVVVEVVEDGQAELVALTIVGLWNSTTERHFGFYSIDNLNLTCKK
jgi:hypothetical protein